MTSQHKQNYSHYKMTIDEEDGIELGNVFISIHSFFVCVMVRPITLRV